MYAVYNSGFSLLLASTSIHGHGKDGRIMDAEVIAALATSGATTIVQAAATDVWSQTKQGFARLFGRGDAAATARAEAELERTNAELALLDQDDRGLAARQQRLRWESQLTGLLREVPGAQRDLEELLSALGLRAGVRVEANAYDNARQNVQGSGTQNVTFS